MQDDHCRAEVALVEDAEVAERESEVFCRSLLSQFEQYVQLGKKVPSEVLASLNSIDEPSRLVDTMVAHMALNIEQKQEILEITDLTARVEHVLALLDGEIDLLQVEKRIRGRVKKQMERSQREYYLNEQMKAIQKELGDGDEGHNEVDELKKRIDGAGLTKEAHAKAQAELNKLKQMSPMSAEATVVRSYLEWLLNVPWKAESKVRLDLTRAEEILDADHYGLEEVKERILEYLAVQKRVKKLKGPVLCLVGPPGVGKTSLAESIARSTNRKFVRMALGGVRDEAEIRGHRRTYIGSMPGRLIQKMTKVGVRNPLFLLDEIDKLGSDMRGDPASALLEVLDPEQNHNFNDHYLEVDYDLSDVMFLCTANSMNIPAPLLDRMEVIRLPGYTEDEKVNIAVKYLVPKQVKANGLKDSELAFDEAAIRDIIRYLHSRSWCAQPGAADRQGVPQGGQGAHQGKTLPGAGDHRDAGALPGRAQVPLWPGRAAGSGWPGDRPGLDSGGWRIADHRDGGCARQGAVDQDRLAGRCHGRVDDRRADRGAQPGQEPGHCGGFSRETRRPHSHA